METEDEDLCQNNWEDVNQTFNGFTSDQKWEDEYDHVFNQMKDPGQVNVNDLMMQGVRAPQAWDPSIMLSNLSFMEQKIHQLQNLVTQQQQQQQLISTDVTSLIIQLISTAASLLPSVNQNNISTTALPVPSPYTGQASSSVFPSPKPVVVVVDHEEHEMKDEDEGDDLLPPGSYEILQLEKEEILAPHTHFCTICGKGFKRDANLRMHMRGHGDEYKTPAALAKPNKESSIIPDTLVKRYSCPFLGCKRNKDHKKFQPLKTILCVKNHYKRTHCDKSFICSRCHIKKFSVIADLKTHEKHCGKSKWLCSCGTTFSRKDKLFGHITLFQGHTPAIPIEDSKPCSQKGRYEARNGNETMVGFNIGSSSNAQIGIMEGKISFDECFSPLSFDTCNFGGFHEFP